MNNTMTAEEILCKIYGFETVEETKQYLAIETLSFAMIIEAMEEYGKQCYIQGSNDCHKAMIDSLPSNSSILLQQGYYPTMEEERAFHAGAMWVIKTIKGK